MNYPILQFLDQAKKKPEAIALRDNTDAFLTYGELANQSVALAAGLQKRLRRHEQPIIAIAAKNHNAHVAAMFGVFLAGYSWVPLNPRSAKSLNDKIINRLKPSLIIRDRACADCVSDSPDTIEFSGEDSASLEAMSAHLDSWRKPTFSSNDTMCIKLTGGTTGTPKAVAQTQEMIATVISDFQSVFDFKASDVNLAVAPLSHGAFHLLLPILAAGGCHEIMADPDTEAILECMERAKVSVAFMPPTLIIKLMTHPAAIKERFTHLRHLIYGAAPMPPPQIKKARNVFGATIAVLYGQVEAPVAISAMTAAQMEQTGKWDSVGRPCPSNDVKIASRLGEETGEIMVRGPITATSYISGETSPLKDGWLATGDLGHFDEDGFLYIRGRSREIIISGGFNVYPAEVERALLSVDGVDEVCVIGVADDYWGERVEAVIVSGGADDEALSNAVREAIGAVAVPKVYHHTDSLPRNPVGKVVRREVALIYNLIG